MDYYFETLYFLLLNLTFLSVDNINVIIDYLPVMVTKIIAYSNENEENDDYEFCTCIGKCICGKRSLVRHTVFNLTYPINWVYSNEYLIELLNSHSDYSLLYALNGTTIETIQNTRMIINEDETNPDDYTDKDVNCHIKIYSQKIWYPSQYF